VLPQHTDVEIAADGTISVQAPGAATLQAVDRLRVVSGDARELTKNEAGLIVSRSGAQLPADPNLTVRARALEGANVSAVEEMVATMTLNRSFEIQMKLLTASDSMNQAGDRLLGA
jgi:flagellar basal-body rod protein FlgF